MTRSFKLPAGLIKAGFSIARNGYLTERHTKPKAAPATVRPVSAPGVYPSGPQDASEIMRITVDQGANI